MSSRISLKHKRSFAPANYAKQAAIFTPSFHVGLVNRCFSNLLSFRPMKQNKANPFAFHRQLTVFQFLTCLMTYRYQVLLIHTQMGGATSGRRPRQDNNLLHNFSSCRSRKHPYCKRMLISAQ